MHIIGSTCGKKCIRAAFICSAASVYSGYEVDDDWCVSVLQSYQAEGDVAFPWSVGKSQLFSHLRVAHTLLFHFTGLLHALTHSQCCQVRT